MKIKTNELTGTALDWAVAACEETTAKGLVSHAKYSTDWAQGGPIIALENISVIRCDTDYQSFPDNWLAERGANRYCESTEHQQHEAMIQFNVCNNGSRFAKDGPFYGPTPLIAAMRCYVASKLGAEVDIPDELVLPGADAT